MPCTYPHKVSCAVPPSLVKSYRLETQTATGQWRTVFRDTDNYQRLVRVPFQVEVQALRFVAENTWGDAEARLFAFEPLDQYEEKIPSYPAGAAFHEVRARVNPRDLAPPDSVVAAAAKTGGISA
jgi:predicted nucleic acid-binding protein